MGHYVYLTEWLKNTLERIDNLNTCNLDDMVTLTITKGNIKEQVSLGFVEVETEVTDNIRTTDEKFVEDWVIETKDKLDEDCPLNSYTTLLEDVEDKSLVNEIALEMIKQDVREELKSESIDNSLDTLYTEQPTSTSFTDILKG